MLKSAIITATFIAAASQATADSGDMHDLSVLPPDVAARVIHLQQYGDRFEATIEAIFAEWEKPAYANKGTAYDTSMLPPEVAARVIDLQQHGERFEPAIRAIYIEAMKPTWNHWPAPESVAVTMKKPQS